MLAHSPCHNQYMFLALVLTLAASLPVTARPQPASYIFDRPICTGLGDRLGTMLSLAALARLENATVAFLWCDDPAPAILRIRPHVPSWVGFNYSLPELQKRFKLPPEIRFVSDLSHWRHLPPVQWNNDKTSLPAEMGQDAIPEIAWRTMRMGDPPPHMANVFQEAYRAVTEQLVPNPKPPAPLLVIHLRGPDENTYWTPDHGPTDHYCTAAVVRELWDYPVQLHVVSNNLSWARALLGTKGHLFHMNPLATPYDDLELLLSASAIIQHAWGGWSSYSTVPAVISRVPMINTYDIRRPHHRFHHFQRQLGLPANFYDCGRIQPFVYAVQEQLAVFRIHGSHNRVSKA